MGITILIKFCGFIVHSKLNNMARSAFPGKISETRKIVLNFLFVAWRSAWQTDQSRSNSTSTVPLQITLVRFFRFRSTLKIKGSSHKKKIKIFIISKMAPTIFIKFYGFIAHSNPNNMNQSAFFPKKKILVTRIIFFNFLSVA